MDDDLWALIAPLLPPWPARSPGPRPMDDRLCLQGILYVLLQDIAWQLLRTSPRPSTSSTASRPLPDDPVGPDGGRSASWATRRTTRRLYAVSCDAAVGLPQHQGPDFDLV
ncbi:transposase [Streptomyces sp. PSAA01]|uniref:transposase n=1 Tax=Streptomyces sp. PSAA01 TaxID=2912762 RepID=UPI0035AB80A9